jgi:hypothetical protein
MYSIWIVMNGVAGQVRRRIRSVVRNEAGALTLEWIIIAVALVAAGSIAAVLFDAAIRNEATKLP